MSPSKCLIVILSMLQQFSLAINKFIHTDEDNYLNNFLVPNSFDKDQTLRESSTKFQPIIIINTRLPADHEDDNNHEEKTSSDSKSRDHDKHCRKFLVHYPVKAFVPQYIYNGDNKDLDDYEEYMEDGASQNEKPPYYYSTDKMTYKLVRGQSKLTRPRAPEAPPPPPRPPLPPLPNGEQDEEENYNNYRRNNNDDNNNNYNEEEGEDYNQEQSNSGGKKLTILWLGYERN